MEFTGLVMKIHIPGHPVCQTRHFLITACVDKGDGVSEEMTIVEETFMTQHKWCCSHVE
jgi:hypothetical protein